MHRIVSNGLLALAFVLLVLGAWFGFTSINSTHILRAEMADQDLGEIETGDRTVSYWLINMSSETVKVSGQCGGCGKNCCLRPRVEFPFTLAPGEMTEVESILSVPEPGPFEIRLTLNAQATLLDRVNIHFCGTATTPRD